MRRVLQRIEAQVITMTQVYVYMCLGLIISAVAAWVFAYVPEFNQFLYTSTGNGMATLSIAGWVVVLAPLLMLLAVRFINDIYFGTTLIFFIVFSLLMGASLSSVFMVYTDVSIIQCFSITSGTFGVMSFYGMVTQKDLSSLGNILVMALIGIIIAILVNIFLQSSMLDFVVSIIGILVFTGLTAHDTQKIKTQLNAYNDTETCKKIAVWGALSLYLDFINLLLMFLRLLGKKK